MSKEVDEYIKKQNYPQRADLSEKEIELFEGSGKTIKHIKIHSLEDINEKEIVKLLKIIK